jgi:hypothetical protein
MSALALRTARAGVRRLVFSCAAPGTRADTPARLLAELCERFDPERAGAVRATVDVEVHEPDEGSSHACLRIGDGRCAVLPDVPRGSRKAPAPDVRLKIRRPDLALLVRGRASAGELFMQQRLTVFGDMLVAAQLAGVFRW